MTITEFEARGHLQTMSMVVDSLARQVAEDWPLTDEDRSQIRDARTKLREIISLTSNPELLQYCSELLAKLEPLDRPVA